MFRVLFTWGNMEISRLFKRKHLLSLVVFVLIISIIGTVLFAYGFFVFQRTSDLPQSNGPYDHIDNVPAVIIAQDLQIPWSLDILPDGSLILTERPGRVRLIDRDEGLLNEPLAIITEVSHTGEGGLLGVAVHPDFEDNHLIYLYYTYRDGERLYNRVVSYTMENRELVQTSIIIDHIPGAGIHNGGRIGFGPDGMLYICTGDASEPDLSQDITSLAGKILRITDTGSVPEDNPIQGSFVYSLGHRNPQGLAWDEQDRLWATEHGPIARDELNIIYPGKNYGWPVIVGADTAEGMESPFLHSSLQTWAPSGAAYMDGSVFFAGLRGQSLYEAVLIQEDRTLSVELKQHFKGDLGRLRDVVAGKDGNIYVLTSNRDGRGVAIDGDDRVIRINTSML